MEQGGGDVIGRAGIRRGSHALGVGGAVSVAALETAAGQEHRHRPGPVVATGILVNLRRTAEFPGTIDRRPVQQATIAQVLDEGRQRLIQLRQQALRRTGGRSLRR